MQTSQIFYNATALYPTLDVEKRCINLAHAQKKLESQIRQKKTELLFAREKCNKLSALLEIYKKNTTALEQIRSLQELKIHSLRNVVLGLNRQSLD